jgi:hypothetical protein
VGPSQQIFLHSSPFFCISWGPARSWAAKNPSPQFKPREANQTGLSFKIQTPNTQRSVYKLLRCYRTLSRIPFPSSCSGERGGTRAGFHGAFGTFWKQLRPPSRYAPCFAPFPAFTAPCILVIRFECLCFDLLRGIFRPP